MSLLTQRQTFLPAIEVVGVGFCSGAGNGLQSIGFSNSSISSWLARYPGTAYGVWGSAISTTTAGTIQFSVGNKSTGANGTLTTSQNLTTSWVHAENTGLTVTFSTGNFLYPIIQLSGATGTVNVQLWFVVRPT